MNLTKKFTVSEDDTIIHCEIWVSSSTVVGTRSTHPDFEDMPPRARTQYKVAGHINGYQEYFAETFNEDNLINMTDSAESNLRKKCKGMIEQGKKVTVTAQLRAKGYE